MVFWGYVEGSKLVRPLSLQIKTGLKEWPEVYAMLAHLAIGLFFFTRTVYRSEKYHFDWTNRYKNNYTVFRKDDQRLRLYPKPWVTDTELLHTDHPMTTREIGWFHFPVVEVHRSDPHMRGEDYDGKPPVAKIWKFPWKLTHDPMGEIFKQEEEEEEAKAKLDAK